MGKLDNFQIVFDHPQGVFYAGQTVSGHVKITLNEAMKMRGIVMRLFGKAKVHWSVSSGKSRTHYRSEEIYFDCKIELLEMGNQECVILQIGSHSYPFRMSLSPALPSSFEGKYGYVRYLAEVTIDRPWKFDHTAKAAFTVLSIVDLNLEQPSVREPFILHENKNVDCCCCCISGIVDAMITINRRCFVPGEVISLSTKITNNSNTLIPNCTATLEQHIKFRAQQTSFFSSGSYYFKDRKEVIGEMKLNEIAAGATEEWKNIGMLVPSIPPSRLVGCEIIDITYILVFDINVEYSYFQIPIEIVIGTIPLRLPCPVIPVITTQPSISELPLEERERRDLPPPFQNDSAGLTYDMAPPSYEEYVLGKVTIKEETDSDYVRGNLNWAPVYPMYRGRDSLQGN